MNDGKNKRGGIEFKPLVVSSTSSSNPSTAEFNLTVDVEQGGDLTRAEQAAYLIDGCLVDLKQDDPEIRSKALSVLLHFSNMFPLVYVFKFERIVNLIFSYSFLKSTNHGLFGELMQALSVYNDVSHNRAGLFLNIIDYIDNDTPDEDIEDYLRNIIWVLEASNPSFDFIIYALRESTFNKISGILEKLPQPDTGKVIVSNSAAVVKGIILPKIIPTKKKEP